MTDENLIRIAREAGWTGPEDNLVYVSMLKRFAALVIANNPPQSSMAWQEGFEAGKKLEREACAKLCDKFNFGQAPKMIQDAIRARGQA
jgi:hypothetical protein